MAKRFEETDEGLKMLVYGQPGCGKTTLLATMCDDPRFGHILDLNAYGNPQVMRRRERKPDIITLEQMSDFNAPYAWLMDGQKKNDPFCTSLGLNPPYKTVFIDSTTEVQRFIASIINGSVKMDPGEMVGALGRQGFGQLFGTMMHWSKSMLELTAKGINVIFACHEAYKQDERQVYHYEPLIWGQSGLELCGYALLVMRLTVRNRVDPDLKASNAAQVLAQDVFNVAQIRATTQSYAKDQYDCGVDFIVNPTMGKLLDLIEQGS